MNINTIHISQGSSLRLLPGEARYLANVFKNRGIGLECIDFSQDIVNFPQAYVGYINMPNRNVIIDSKHEGIELSHLIRIYYFCMLLTLLTLMILYTILIRAVHLTLWKIL